MSLKKKNHKFVVMKDILFKILFPSKHEEIMSLTKKTHQQGYYVRMLEERSVKQSRTIQKLNEDLKEVRSAAKEYQKKQTAIAEQEYYKTLKAKGLV